MYGQKWADFFEAKIKQLAIFPITLHKQYFLFFTKTAIFKQYIFILKNPLNPKKT
jgi:hypothetical protein